MCLKFVTIIVCMSLLATGLNCGLSSDPAPAFKTLPSTGDFTGNGEVDNMNTIDSPIAGVWYTSNPNELRTELLAYLNAERTANVDTAGDVVGIVAPHAGYRYSGKIAGLAYQMIAKMPPRRVVVIAPSHHFAFTGAALPDANNWKTPLGLVEIDTSAIATLSKAPNFATRNDVFQKEHAVDIHVPFIQMVAPKASVVPIVVGKIDSAGATQIGLALAKLLDGHTIIVASSDFTHYGRRFGYVPFTNDVDDGLQELLTEATESIVAKDVERFAKHLVTTGDTICGEGPIRVLLNALPMGSTGRLLKTDTSARMTGDREFSVSYASIVFVTNSNDQDGIHPTSSANGFIDRDTQLYLLDFARRSIENKLSSRQPFLPPEPIPAQIKEARGVFVTLHKHGDLRGCIGSIFPTEPLVEGVQRRAIDAAINDPRFSRVQATELADIEIEISVLTRPVEVPSRHSIRIGIDGVILANGHARAVFLPQVAPEQGWDLDTTLSHLSVKAGLGRSAYLDPKTTFSTFEAQVFSESD